MLSNESEISSQIKWLGRIKISELSNKSLIIASQLSREIKKANGSSIKLHDESMTVRLAEQVIEINSPKLNKLYRSFLEETIESK